MAHSPRSAAAVSGGFINTANGPWSSVGGGRENAASGIFSSVSGGVGNKALAPTLAAWIGGGVENEVFSEELLDKEGRSASIFGGKKEKTALDFAAIP